MDVNNIAGEKEKQNWKRKKALIKAKKANEVHFGIIRKTAALPTGKHENL